MTSLHSLKSGVRRALAMAVEVHVPALGTSFGALAASVRAEGVFLSTFQELLVGTRVVATLALPDGPLVVGGLVVARSDLRSPGIAVEFDDVNDVQRMRLAAASSSVRPVAYVA